MFPLLPPQSQKQSYACKEMQPSLLIEILNQNIYFFYFFNLHAIIEANHAPQSPGTQFILIIERAFSSLMFCFSGQGYFFCV